MNRAATGAQRQAFATNWPARLGWIALGLYTIYAGTLLDLTWARFVDGLGHGGRFIARMFPPDVSKLDLLWRGLSESIEISIIATALSCGLFQTRVSANRSTPGDSQLTLT